MNTQNSSTTPHGTYAFKAIEQKWQDFWQRTQSDAAAEKSTKSELKPQYILEMLPYPSGKLHMGHVRNYAIGDAIARFMRLKGFAVIHPMGWDAFGLPAENAAMQNKTHPKDWTLQNIEEMKRQMKMLGLSYNWQREVATCLPSYYKHQQKLFKQFLEKGLLEQKESWVNFDPVEQSVLANEQVVNGRGWRSGAIVEKRLLRQWSCKITHYADELLEDLETLKDGWPSKVLKMQENWIGRSKGATVHFQYQDEDSSQSVITIFTTRPDTLFGCSFIAIAPTHPLSLKLALKNPALKDFIAECQKMIATEEALSTAEKKGFATGVFVNHPFDSSWKIPVYIANFVLMEYGTGAIFGCPAHDERDFEFACKYNLPIKQVVASEDGALPYLGDGLIINSSEFLNGLTSENAKEMVIQKLKELELGEEKITYRLRDWLVSRQRYWGCPIPIIHCDTCGAVPVPDDQLPVTLPDDVSFDKPGNPLDHHPSWKQVSCPSCGSDALRETDTLDTFFDSSWYFLRYTSPLEDNIPINKEEANKWAPVAWYIGGIEHAVLHLLYARFFTKVLRDLGYISFDEPFTNLLTQGMVCHETYQDHQGQWLYPSEVSKNEKGEWIINSSGQPAVVGGSIKMSKSKKNLVDPLEILASYGADVARLFVLSDTPAEKDFDWNTEALEGCWRYLNRVVRLVDSGIQRIKNKQEGISLKSEALHALSHQSLFKIVDAFEKQAFNKVVALHREFARIIEDHLDDVSAAMLEEALSFYILSLSPIAPHLAFESFEMLTEKSIDDVTLPSIDMQLVNSQQITIAVQVNGKMRGTFHTEPDLDDKVIQDLAQSVESVIPHIQGKDIKKIIVIKNRLVNIVVV